MKIHENYSSRCFQWHHLPSKSVKIRHNSSKSVKFRQESASSLQKSVGSRQITDFGSSLFLQWNKNFLSGGLFFSKNIASKKLSSGELSFSKAILFPQQCTSSGIWKKRKKTSKLWPQTKIVLKDKIWNEKMTSHFQKKCQLRGNFNKMHTQTHRRISTHTHTHRQISRKLALKSTQTNFNKI